MAQTIRAWREARKLTQLQLANLVGVTPSTVYGWEKGKYEPKARQLRALSEAFGVKMEEIELIEVERKIAA